MKRLHLITSRLALVANLAGHLPDRLMRLLDLSVLIQVHEVHEQLIVVIRGNLDMGGRRLGSRIIRAVVATSTLFAVGQRISVLVNSAAGSNRGLNRTKTLVADLADRGWTVDLLKAGSAGEVASAIDGARTAGAGRLILAGGDGLIHHALPALVDSSIVVGIVPVGTGNDFCRGLGLPTKRRAALGEATGESVIAVDVIRVAFADRVHYAATVLTAGFSGRVNRRANEMSRRRLLPKGASRYTIATLAELAALEPVPFRLRFDDDEPLDQAACLIAVGNTRFFGGGMSVCPDAVYDDGALDVTVIEAVSRPTFASVLPLVFSGHHVRHASVSQRRCQRLSVTTGEPLWADGELLEQGEPASVEANVSVLPGALLVASRSLA